MNFTFAHNNLNVYDLDASLRFYKEAREFDTLKSKNVPQSLEIGLFFVKFLFLIYSNV